MAKAKQELRTPCPVGVVMRSDVPLIESLLADEEQTRYSVAIDQAKTTRRWISLSAPALLSLMGLLDFFKLTR